jgi:hypothetical protein
MLASHNLANQLPPASPKKFGKMASFVIILGVVLSGNKPRLIGNEDI